MSTPNLFDGSVKELSYDLVYAWLLKCADKQYKDGDKQMHELGVNFLALLSGENPETLKQKTVTVVRQEHKIDILVTVQDTFVLVIENKTFTSLHGDQLKKYSDYGIANAKNIKINKVIFCYVKIGSESGKVLNEIRNFTSQNLGEVKYKTNIVDGSQIKGLLNSYTGDNLIVTMFKDFISEQQDILTSNKLSDLQKNKQAAIGLLHQIQAKLKERNINSTVKLREPYYYPHLVYKFTELLKDTRWVYLELGWNSGELVTVIIFKIADRNPAFINEIKSLMNSKLSAAGLKYEFNKKRGQDPLYRFYIEDAFKEIKSSDTLDTYQKEGQIDDLNLTHLQNVMETLESIVSKVHGAYMARYSNLRL